MTETLRRPTEVPAPDNRSDVEFDSDGVTLRGWYYRASTSGSAPTIVMCHGFAAVKEMYLDKYAEVFSANGLNVLVYDNRNLGASDGTPRGEINPWQQIDDFRNAITFAETLEGTDPDRIGIWGSSYSGAHVLVVAAQDRRVKCVSSQVPVVDGDANFRQLVRADFIDGARGGFNEDRRARFRGEDPVMVEVVNKDPMAPSALPTPDSYEWFIGTQHLRAPGFVNQTTLRSVERFSEYQPGAFIRLISPTPLLVCVAANDVLTPTKITIDGFHEAREPKKLVVLPGGHFDAYVDGFEESSSIQLAWFTEHLLTKTTTGA
ncbi:alpha/beta fold hydrolase [Xylanimonas allomyrinae]|uniref:Alpha/beta fold hydrolase n=1 Tax=Xylanimonas allomyrinae TaxID=2509459 RepID=A0A4P6EUR3_9MICO|nr:alpha/beta fold hydrolase [Xylanimonas allomyrinae]QAY64197.1 alpha/beta fold hydrolase [Xylanimonas allomyrinae]